LTIAREIDHRQGEALWLGNLGGCYLDLGQTNRAINLCKQALNIVQEIGYRQGEGACLDILGSCYSILGQIDHTIDLYNQALIISREIGDRYGEGALLASLARVMICQRNYEKAIQLTQDSLIIGKEIENPIISSYGNSYLALAHLYNKNLNEALDAIKAASEYHVLENKHHVFSLRGIITLRQGDQVAGREACTAAVEAADRILAQSPNYYDALDARGLALAGLVLCEADSDCRTDHLARAKAAFRAARAVTQAPGIVASVIRLLDALAEADPINLLSEVRATAAGES
jgi:tetratricopeptide (TPR) repeat protein